MLAAKIVVRMMIRDAKMVMNPRTAMDLFRLSRVFRMLKDRKYHASIAAIKNMPWKTVIERCVLLAGKTLA